MPRSSAVIPLEPAGRSVATRRRILAAAAAALVEGQGMFEIGDVAKRAGVSVGLSYHHFGSKAGLIATVVEDYYDRFEAAVMDVNPKPGADWGERERLRTERMVAFHYGETLAPVILTRLSREPEVAAVEAARIDRHIALAARNIRLAQERGEIPAELDAPLLGAMILGGLRQAIGQALAAPKRPAQARLVDQLWAFIAGTARFRDARRSKAGKKG
ncbi:MAG TPA: TetR/AcrR family transcriptional regulator [Ferrovibrio sp.]|uniref:TetR/AcrR family transcriptional regulator n=1 Tax=Ferrovibrio sp. TaxID=1917215 RepID=UPI002B4AC5E6|nr:TetR/AcrR family transcriptional regulator [Ferrovibrio sp.]HLT76458.1 TetR/AcrR family transcriptional regulator [Ferrovibrio sp.]